jgi:hypothetical protein
MGHTIEMRCKEHTQYSCLYQLDKLAVVKHNIEKGHCINFKDTKTLAKTMGYMD